MTPADLVRVAVEKGREEGIFFTASEAMRLYAEYGVHPMVEFLSRLYSSEDAVREFVARTERER